MSSNPSNKIATSLIIALTLALGACSTGTQVAKDAPARAAKREAIKVDDVNAALFQKGVTLMKDERMEEAIPVFEAVLQSVGEVSGPYVNIGIARGQLGQLDKAEEALKKAIALDPNHVQAHNELGIIYRKAGRFDEARAMYEQALKLDADYAKAHVNLGMLCDIYLQDLDCAIEHYERYRELSPDEEQTMTRWIATVRQRLESAGG